MCIVATAANPTTLPLATTATAALCPAQLLDHQERQQLALAAWNTHSITNLARHYGVSRKFICRQRHHAQHALDAAFAPPGPEQEPVLFWLPVTRVWLEQFLLALVLIGHCSLRAVGEILRDLFDYSKSLGWLQAVVQRACDQAVTLNAQQELTFVQQAAPDEIFPCAAPIVVVVDVASSYCCLLSLEERRDAITGGVRLLQREVQGFHPRCAIADGGQGLRAGLQLACPDVPCWADQFHPLRDLGRLLRFLDNRAYRLLTRADQLHQPRSRRRSAAAAARPSPDLEQAQREADTAVTLADDVALLAGWLRQDVLAVSGPPLAVRRELFAFVVAELARRVTLCPHRLQPVVSQLQTYQEELLAFAEELDQDLGSLGAYLKVPAALLREVLAVQEVPQSSPEHWRRAGQLRGQLGVRYDEFQEWVQELRRGVVRASSVVENLNSRLRNYFFLRREVGGRYLELLRFFLKHRRFLRSEHPEGVGKSPAELLSGQEHGHWLELLGYQRFRRAG